MDICLRVLKESKISRFDSNSVKNSVFNISHITFRDCRVHIFFDNLSRNSCRCAPVNPCSFSLKTVYVSKRAEWVFSSVSN